MSGRDSKESARVLAVCLSPIKGVSKESQDEIVLIDDYGVDGDAHAGKWHRQVSLLSKSSIDYMRERGAQVGNGSFGENIVIEGLEVSGLELGSIVYIGEKVALELTQVGKECHELCAIGRSVGECIMPSRGVFCRVLKGGKIRPGDSIEIEQPPSSTESRQSPSPVEGERSPSPVEGERSPSPVEGERSPSNTEV